MKSKISFIFGRIIQFFLSFLRKIEKIDHSFPIYFPKYSKREIELWYFKVIKPLFKIDVHYRRKINSSVPIDIIIPTIDKDIDLLEKVIIAAKKNIKHPINKIFVISNNSLKLKEIITKYSCNFIEESTILPISKESIFYCFNGLDRSGWLFQQLLKLSADQISTQDYFLVLDSDTIFVKPKIFIYKNKMILDHSDEYHMPYFDTYHNLMKVPAKSDLSFISHYMLFNKKYLQELKKFIEKQNGQSWTEAILMNVNYNELSGFSEYETYGNYMLTFHKKKIIREYFHNLSCNEIPTSIPNFYKSLSLHSYNRKY
jgi:hypothetical protein